MVNLPNFEEKETWLALPFTSAFAAEVKKVSTVRLAWLLGACESSTDPKVVAAYWQYKNLLELLRTLGQKEKP